MQMTLKELEDKLKEIREQGALDDTPIDFDIDDIGYDEYYPNIHFRDCFSEYTSIDITFTGSNI